MVKKIERTGAMTKEEFRGIFQAADDATQKRLSEMKSCWTILEEELFKRLRNYEVKK